ncbi:MAG TPA: rhamnan synthesis F family protein [Nitrospirota bacterium]|nr:rhamnan synthesis F family protein [Nitrospirota bacterium]
MKRLLCYAHFDERDELKPFVKHAINAMREHCVEILFVSNSPLSHDDEDYLQVHCSNVIINDNRGYDFYMWKLALSAVDCSDFDEIVLMNSSVFGPISPLAPVFEVMSKRNNDFWGITECFQIRPHIQSYFLVFKNNVINSKAFHLFWNGVLPSNDKNQVVLSYEIGLTQWLIESGFKAEAYRNFNHISNYCKSIGKKIRISDNYSIKHLIELFQIGNPFIKVEPVKNSKIDKNLISKLLNDNGYAKEYIEVCTTESLNSCPVCNYQGKIYYTRGKDRFNLSVMEIYQYYKCCNTSCGAFWIYPLPNDQTMKLLYNRHYTSNQLVQTKVALTKKTSVLRLVALLIPKLTLKTLGLHLRRKRFYLYELDRVSPGKLLEIGCGSGDRLVELKKSGWDVVGQDIDKNYYEKMSDDNIPFIMGNTDQLEGNQFDVILLSNGIERVKEPVSLLIECRRLLKEKGKIYLTTPNNQSFTHFIFGKYWRGLDAPIHLIIYNINSLTNILLSAGFKDIKVCTVALNTESFAMYSMDILINKWTNTDFLPRMGKEFVPVFLQLVSFFLNSITRVHGDECFAIASKDR